MVPETEKIMKIIKFRKLAPRKRGLKMSSEDKNGQIVALIHRILVIVEI